MSNNATLQNAKHILTLAGQKGLTREGCNLLVRTGLLADLYEAAGEADLSKVNRDEFRKFVGLLPLELWVTVNYSLSLSEMIAAGHYNFANGNINSGWFSITGTGENKLKAELIHFNCGMSSSDVLAKLDEMGLRPGTIEELLAFGATFPDMQRKFPIVALGSSAKIICDPSVACLCMGDRGASERELSLPFWGGGWSGNYRFLAFRK